MATSSSNYYKSHLDNLGKENKQLKQKLDKIERENRDLKKSIYDLTIKYGAPQALPPCPWGG
jgi:COMPASS component SWD3